MTQENNTTSNLATSSTANNMINNHAIHTMKNHRVYRDFDPDYLIPDDHMAAILDCAQQAPSWMNGQHYSIINITDTHLRSKIGELQPKNPQVVSASAFFIIVGDAYRAKLCAEHADDDFSHVTDPDILITLITDASMAAQNATVAAESLGLGTCPIGGIRLVSQQIIELLNLPKYTLPLYGLCIGKPTVEMRLKPRLPREAVVFNNQYTVQKLSGQLDNYERTMLEFGEAREKLPFRQKISMYFSHEFIAEQEALYRQQGFVE